MPDVHDPRPEPLAAITDAECVDLDVRPILRDGGEPFSLIMDTVGQVPPGHLRRGDHRVAGTGTFTLDDAAPIELRPSVHLFPPAGTPYAVGAEADLTLLATFADAAPEIRFTEP